MYLLMKVVCLFVCFVCVMLRSLESHAPTPRALDTIGKPQLRKGALRLFHNVWTFSGRVIKYFKLIFFLVKLGHLSQGVEF
jgi:hypothetical protein